MASQLPTITLHHVQGAARNIAKLYEKWLLQDGPYVPFNGVPCKSFSAELVEAIEETVDAMADADNEGTLRADVAADARRLMLCLDAIGYSYRKWLQDASMGLSHARPTGSDELDSSLKNLLEVLSQKPLPHPPSVKLLIDQGAPLHIIALKYGWKGEDGAPDVTAVQEELAEPGTHYDPKTWVHPAHRTAAVEVEQAWAKRQPRSPLFNLAEKNAPKPQQRPIEDFFAAHAPVEQIARVFGMEEEEVFELAKSQGVDLTQPRQIVPANETVAHQENMRKQAATAAKAAKRS